MPLTSAVLCLMDCMAIAMCRAYQTARIRAASASSPILRLMIQRGQWFTQVNLYKREADILRAARKTTPAHRRPHYPPEQRLAILQLMRLRGWNVRTTAQCFVLHQNTIRAWLGELEGSRRLNLPLHTISWNRMDDAVRWAVHELRRVFPEPEFGTRTMARHLLRAGIQISRATVQRVLREPKPAKPPRRSKPAMEQPMGCPPKNLLIPRESNHVWHIDLTQFRVLWMRFPIAAILDGFSRKLLALKIYSPTPRARNITALVRNAAARRGPPKFIITDHGTQFGRKFDKTLRRQHIRHIRSRVRAPFLNGKVERFFRTFKFWMRLVLFGPTARNIQRRLDAFADWYNSMRPHAALMGLTPEEAYRGRAPPKAVPVRARDRPNMSISIKRKHYHDDLYLPIVEIAVRRAA